MSHLNRRLLFLLPLAVGIGCRLLSFPPPVTHSSQPTLAVDLEAFNQAGCAPDEYGSWTCPAGSPVNALLCDRLRTPNDLLGGLNPAYPLAHCQYLPIQHSEDPGADATQEYIYRDGCLMPAFNRYAIFKDGQFQLLKNPADLQATYAPIETSEEALSYALAATGNMAIYGFEAPPGYRYLIDEIEDTHVVETSEGYRVLLYDYQVCGCGPHTTSAVWLEVSKSGEVKEAERTPAFENPEEDGLCVD